MVADIIVAFLCSSALAGADWNDWEAAAQRKESGFLSPHDE